MIIISATTKQSKHILRLCLSLYAVTFFTRIKRKYCRVQPYNLSAYTPTHARQNRALHTKKTNALWNWNTYLHNILNANVPSLVYVFQCEAKSSRKKYIVVALCATRLTVPIYTSSTQVLLFKPLQALIALLAERKARS